MDLVAIFGDDNSGFFMSAESMPMSELIRPALPGDAEAACTVLRRSISQCCVKDHHNDVDILSAWLGNKTPAAVANWFASPANFSFVAFHDSRIVGVAMLTALGRIALCYVDPQYCRTGIGSQLLRQMEAEAGERGIESLRVESTVTASSFYLHNGFNPLGAIKTAFGATGQAFIKRLGSDRPGNKKKLSAACACTQNDHGS